MNAEHLVQSNTDLHQKPQEMSKHVYPTDEPWLNQNALYNGRFYRIGPAQQSWPFQFLNHSPPYCV